MASSGVQLEEIQHLQESPPDPAFIEAQKWIEQVTGRSFAYKDFRTGLENGILLCELLNTIKPGLVKKINRLPTPIAGLDNIILFLRGCKELGLKDSQLFDPGDLQDSSNRVTVKNTDCNRKLKNVLVTIYWLGKAANNCTSFNGAILNLKEFEGLLTQMRKETEDIESPRRSIRDSGYIDCWDSERSDSLSPPRHGRDDSFDSLDSFGSRSQQTPSPDVVLRGSSDGRGSDSESELPHRRIPDMKKDDMLARRTSYGEIKTTVPFNQYLPNKSNQTAYIPAPLRKKRAERGEYRKSWSTATSPLGGERPFRSMSMFDMRDEEEAVVQPHTRAYQEQLQNVNRQLKEEDEKWQDDLARWKNRRRSASQDLIKKEEERKKLERLISGEYDLSERRRSIKTYKEIVEEKERREKELHEAYKKAASREEAEMVLQKYVEKFTISEAILERLQMPKNLERRYSVESSSLSPSKEPSPMKYLRQQSLPAPKYTATFEATIVPTSESEAAVSTDLTSSNKAVVTKAVPMLTPKPYSQPKNKQVLKTFKVDGKESMNGEVCNGIEERERGCAAFAPSLSRSQMFEGVARVAESPTEPKQDTANVELSLKNPKSNSVSKELTVRSEHNDTIREETEAANQREETDSAVCAEWQNLELVLPEGFKQSEKASGHFSASVTSLEFTPSYHPKEPVAKDTDQSGGAGETCVAVTQKEVTSKADDQDGGRVFEYFKTVPETCQVIPHTPDQQVDSNSSEKSAHQVLTPSVNASKHFNFWAWDPEEERKRQERWQQEQERLLQERYQKEQEKLKEEWVKAQKEVEEEERKYYEEERKIIEDTVVPLSTSLSSADLPSSSNSSSTAQTNRNSQPLERALPEQEEEPESHTVAESSSGAYQVKQRTCETIREQQDLMWDLDEGSFHKSREGEMWKEKKSVNKVTAGHPEPAPQRASEQGQQMLMAGQDSSAGMNLNLLQDTSWDHEFLTKESCVSKDVRLKTPPLDYGSSHKVYSTGGMKRTSSSENVRVGQASPCSPSQQCQSPNRSVSGKKLCSSCGLPLGKGAAMIIETLNLYFHIQCFKCGICKGELGDVATGTDVRIRNGVLNCNDCYIRSRTAGQPTTL